MSAHVIPEGPGTPKRQKFPFLRGSLGFGAREAKTGITSIACSIATCMTRGVGHRLASLDVFWLGGRQIACLPSTSYDLQKFLILVVAVVISAANYLMRQYVVIKMWKYASPSIEEFFDTLEDAQQYATILNRQQQFVEAETHFEVFQAVQG